MSDNERTAETMHTEADEMKVLRLERDYARERAERRVIDRAMVLVAGYKLGQTDDHLYDLARLTEAVDALDALT